jgi:uncharacterized protein YbjQ (UPF0145 family)
MRITETHPTLKSVKKQLLRGAIKHRIMILTNTENIPGKEIQQCLGVVSGSTVRAKHFGRDFLSGLKNIIGGELKAYTELLGDSRKEATQRMIDQASQLGADAVVNVRYSTSSIAAGASEIYVYGTAVTLST